MLQCADAKISAPWDVKAEVGQANGFFRPGGNQELIDRLNAFYESLPDLKYEGHTGEIDDVLSALEEGRRPMITGEDGRKTVELISAIYKAGCTRSIVSLPITKDDDYYTFQGILKHAVHFHEKTASVENFAEEAISLGNYEEKK